MTYGLLKRSQNGGGNEKVAKKTKNMSWGKTTNLISRKIVDPEQKKQARELEIAGKWNRFTRKLLQKDKIREQRINWKWRRLVNDVLKLERNRSLFIQAKFSRMIRTYVKYRANRKKLQAVGRLRKLSMKLLRYHQEREEADIHGGQRFQTDKYIDQASFEIDISWAVEQRGRIIVQKVLLKLRHSANKSSKGVDWTKGMNQLKAEMSKSNKTKSLMNISRWNRLIHGILRRADAQGNHAVEAASPSLTNMTANSSYLGSRRGSRRRKMSKKVLGRWRNMVELLMLT